MNAIVTVIGKDRVGIMAGVCVAFEKANVNVLDINQTILKDMFTMNMLVDMKNANVSFSELVDILDKEGDPDMRKRIRLYPLITFGPFMFVPLLIIGSLLDYFVFNQTGYIVLAMGGLGVLFYVYALVLSVLTLKTEKKAQERAYSILQRSHLANEEELADLKELFRLYNIQYINDIIMASLELIYKLLQIALAYVKKDSND